MERHDLMHVTIIFIHNNK